MRTRWMTLLLVGALAGPVGCVAVAAAGAGAGTYAFVKGSTEFNVDAPYNDVWHVTGEVLREYEITITDQSRDALEGTYKGERHDGSNVVVDVASLQRDVTKVKIRVGAFGDRAFQERFADSLKARL